MVKTLDRLGIQVLRIPGRITRDPAPPYPLYVAEHSWAPSWAVLTWYREPQGTRVRVLRQEQALRDPLLVPDFSDIRARAEALVALTALVGTR